MKKVISLLMAFLIIITPLAIENIVAFADEKNVVVTINGEKEYFAITDDDVSIPLRQAFDYCRSNASVDAPATVTVSAGTYYPTRVVYFASNTSLDLTDVTLVKTNGNAANLFTISQTTTPGGYDSLTNFKLNGGTFMYSADYSDAHCLIRIAHANNISIKNCSFLDSVDAHYIEIAATKSLNIDGCTFSGQKSVKPSTSLEALQIDILEEKQHFVGMYPYDDTMNYGINITNCVFKDLYRGVGTHSIFEGLYQNKINISNNSFTNIMSTAITCSGYINSTVKGNTITNCGEGIHFYMMKGDGYLNSVCKPSVKTPKINTNCASVISNNTISVRSNAITPKASPIYIFGNQVTSAKATNVTSGNYYVGNIQVTSNKISTNGYGIRAYDMLNSKISSNTITYCGTLTGMAGILIGAKSKSNTLSLNTISKFECGINIKEGSTDNSVSSNTISNSTGNAIILQDTSSAKTIYKNTINGAKKVGILVNDKAVATKISSNQISNCTSNAITVNSNGGTITANTFKYNKGFGLYIAIGGKASVYKNTYTSNTKGTAYCKGSKTSYSFTNVSTPSYKLTKANLSSKDKKHKKVVIKWTAPKQSSTYYVYRSTSKNGTYSKIGTIDSSKGQFTDKNVANGKTYYYKIRGIKSMNSTKAYSSYSSVKYIKI